MRLVRSIVIMSLICVFLSACASPEEQVQLTPAPTAVPTNSPAPQEIAIFAPTAAPTPSPMPSPTPDWVTPARQVFFDSLDLDFTVYSEELSKVDLSTYAVVVENTQQFKQLTDDVNASVLAAIDVANESANGLISSPSIYFEPMTWKQVASIVRAFGEQAEQTICDNIAVEITSEGTYTVSIPGFDTIIRRGTELQILTAKFSYAYLNTVYDDDGVEKDYSPYEVPDDYLKMMIDPLPDNHMKNGWYQNREKSTRKHMGMDITGRAKTPIMSVMDGVVTYKGDHYNCGYYIIIMDPYGYEYHYYHFYEPSTLEVGDEVKQGDIVGLMGKTGNSTGNHLHIAIVAPDYAYLNPYEVFDNAGLTDK